MALGTAPSGVPRHDCRGTLVVPGNVCAHHHLYSALSRGMPFGLAPPRNFTEILQRVWWRLDRALDEASVRASALRGGLDALLAGTTTIVDHHASPNFIDGSLDVIADALAELGVRSVLCYEVTDRDGPERAAAGVAENRRSCPPTSAWPGGWWARMLRSPFRTRPSPHVPSGPGGGRRRAHPRSRRRGRPARHAGRGAGRRTWSACRAGIVTDRALLAHCVHVGPGEMQIVASSGATVVCNPRSNMNNGVGHSPFNLAPGRRSRRPGWRSARTASAGTWSPSPRWASSGPRRPTWARPRLVAPGPSRRGVAPRRAACTTNRSWGRCTRGRRPTSPSTSTGPPPPSTRGNLAGHWVFGLSPGQVRDVYVAGELVVADRSSTRTDQAKVAADGARVAQDLWQRLEKVPAHEYEPIGPIGGGHG